MNKILFSSNSDEWVTPDSLYNKLNEEFKFDLDPCSTDKNAKCIEHFTKKDDGLSKDWRGRRVFCNPPYSETING